MNKSKIKNIINILFICAAFIGSMSTNNLLPNISFYIWLFILIILIGCLYAYLYNLSYKGIRINLTLAKVASYVFLITFFVIVPFLQIGANFLTHDGEKVRFKGTIEGVSKPALKNRAYFIHYQIKNGPLKEIGVTYAGENKYGEFVPSTYPVWKEPHNYKDVDAIGVSGPLGIILFKLDI